MYLGIDVGGTKTLLAVFSARGKIIKEHKFATSPTYQQWLSDLENTLAADLEGHHISAACCALPAVIDRQKGVGISFGTMDWRDVPVKSDLENRLNYVPAWVENDAKLAGLSEAVSLKDDYQDMLYVTLSTGIGVAHVKDLVIDTGLGDRGGDGFVLEHDGQLADWEDFASGRALKERYGQLASEITDPRIWSAYAADVAQGLAHFVDLAKPAVVVIGGGVGAHFEKFGALLNKALKRAVAGAPPVIKARRPEEAVIYGCYDFIKQQLDGRP